MTDPRSSAADATRAPMAPQDPASGRNGLYILHDAAIEATARPDGTFAQEIYLDGQRLIDKARYAGGGLDEAILENLRSFDGFRRMVHRIGISVHAHGNEKSPVFFTIHNRGKSGRYESGTRLRFPCPADGSESLLTLEDYDWSPDDEVPGKFAFEFERAGVLATANIIFYLHDGYPVPEPIPEPPVDFGSESYRRMIEKSLLNKGNNKRLKTAIEKAKRGEPVTIAYIGGSITQGAGAVPLSANCYAYRSYELFKRWFVPSGGDSVRFIKAGVGGTPSELGIVRYERDVLRDGTVEPDIVIVEFAVNDADDETKGSCYESLVLKALAGGNKPAVILLFSVFMNDWNLQDRLAPIGWHYQLPMVSVKDAVVEQFRLSKADGNVISKRQFFYDIYHPTNAGHKIMSDCLGWLFEVTDRSAADGEDLSVDKPPLIGNGYVGTRLLDRMNSDGIARIHPGGFQETDAELQMAELDDHSYGTPLFPHNWMHTAESGNLGFKMTIQSRRLILVFKDSGNHDFGTANIWVDGQLKRTADPHQVNWTHCNAVLLYDEEDVREHTVEIAMAEGNEDKRFTILGFGYVP
ncbi:SGNH/GDSL hydrolase family protein [Paenibacillus sp. VCA1]|uniref:SGNH/GDSL hydrolase family protein n=1 Tax=Paenibacillus sp. VCA1 TaxID=3039148 RepID=UPI0028722540|nr:SGNH/GDSL hydrolase family protein [Paenibacillus sp. VCA1]MDR9855156.1 SGNH/GDSL hydrolase family protein [Paenibacillus sp. VCA1]